MQCTVYESSRNSLAHGGERAGHDDGVLLQTFGRGIRLAFVTCPDACSTLLPALAPRLREIQSAGSGYGEMMGDGCCMEVAEPRGSMVDGAFLGGIARAKAGFVMASGECTSSPSPAVSVGVCVSVVSGSGRGGEHVNVRWTVVGADGAMIPTSSLL